MAIQSICIWLSAFLKKKCLPVLVLSFLSSFAIAEEIEIVTASPLDNFETRSQEEFPYDSQTSDSLWEQLKNNSATHTRSQGSPSISIRGSLAAERVLTLIDGMSINPGDGSGTSELLFSEEWIEHVKILKGPASLFYGSSAMSGALKLETKKLEQAHAGILLGSFQKQAYTMQSPFYQGETQHYQGGIYWESSKNNFPYSEGDFYPSGTRDDNSYRLFRSALMGEQKLATWNFQEKIFSAQKEGTSPSVSGFAKTDYYRRATLAMATAEKNQANEQWRNSASYLWTDGQNLQGGTRSFIQNKVWTAETNYTRLEHERVWSSALHYENHHLMNDYSVEKNFEEDRTDFSLQVSQPFGSLIIEPAIRYLMPYNRWVKGITISTRENYWLSYSEGFRYPTLNEKYLEDSVFRANPDIRPESSEQIEFGWKKDWTKHLGSTFKIYHIQYKDLITSDFDGTFYTNRNENQAQAHGVDLELSKSFSQLQVASSISYLHTKDSHNESIPLSPKWQLHFLVNYTWNQWKLQARTNIWKSYYLRDFALGLIAQPDWYTQDIRVDYQFSKTLSAYLALNNITDTAREFDIGYPEMQRNFFFGANYDF